MALVPYAAGMAVADWSTPKIWPFVSGFNTPISLASGTPGFCGAAAGASGDVWALTYDGRLFNVASGGATTLITTFPSGQCYVGLAFGGPSGYPYAVASSGRFYGYPGLPTSGNFNTGCWFAAASSSTLYALCPALSGVGKAPLNGAATGLIALPAALATPTCILYSGSTLAVGGYQAAPTLYGATAAALCSSYPTYVLGVGSGAATLWSAPSQYADAWNQTLQVTGAFDFTGVAWRPDGAQALACCSTGTVEVFSFTSGGALAVAQTVSGVASGCGITVAGDSAHALVAQSGLSQALALAYSAGSWAVGAAVTGLPGIVAVAPAGASGAFAAFSGGVALLNQGAPWTLAANVATSFVPTCLTTDYFGNAWVAGSGAVAQFSPTLSLLASGTWSGAAPTAIAIQQGRVLLAIPGDNLIRVFGLSSPEQLTQQGSYAAALGAKVGLALSTTTLFVLGSGTTQIYGFSGTPFALSLVLSGAVGTYVGTSWSITPLGVGHVPSALCFDASGSLQVATIQNTWWTKTSGAVLTSGIVPQYSGQTQSVPLGAAALLALNNSLYCATALPGVLIQLQ